MKSIRAFTTSLVIAAAVTALAGCSAAPQTESDPGVVTVVEYEVFGMDCPGCHGGLEKLALGMEGVLAAEASWEQKKLTLRLADGAEVSDEAVRATVERANFTAGERLR